MHAGDMRSQVRRLRKTLRTRRGNTRAPGLESESMGERYITRTNICIPLVILAMHAGNVRSQVRRLRKALRTRRTNVRTLTPMHRRHVSLQTEGLRERLLARRALVRPLTSVYRCDVLLETVRSREALVAY